MEYVEIVEERKEICSIASKLVTVKLVRRKETHTSSGEGEIVNFNCANSSPSCESKCNYKMLMEDF